VALRALYLGSSFSVLWDFTEAVVLPYFPSAVEMVTIRLCGLPATGRAPAVLAERDVVYLACKSPPVFIVLPIFALCFTPLLFVTNLQAMKEHGGW
jgi:hypothetical protein